jgi:outer membrane protein OmpA-like peptidoglycan-associated protein
MKRFILGSIPVLSLLVMAGCGHTTPRELHDARAAYQRASQSPTAMYAGPELLDARRALGDAESKAQDGDDDEAKHLAYVAHRKAISANAKADAVAAQQAKVAALQDLEATKQRVAQSTQQQLDQTKTALTQTQTMVETERKAREEADKKAQEAFAKIEGVKSEQQDRGLVLTLSGSVLFPSGKATVLPGAQQRLRDVAQALKEDKRSILIVGHTDAQGNDDKNMELSEKRAESVKKFLAKEGVPEDRIRTQGAGETQPIGDNDTPEGRANNRRVEIVLQDAAQHGEQHGQLPSPQQRQGTDAVEQGAQKDIAGSKADTQKTKTTQPKAEPPKGAQPKQDQPAPAKP